MISRKLFGPPGTGKTTKLLKYVKTFLKLGTPIDKIGYFAFTTKAANEAIDRMLDYHTAFQRKDLKHFRTLHSLAFNQLTKMKKRFGRSSLWEVFVSNLFCIKIRMASSFVVISKCICNSIKINIFFLFI